MKKTWNVIGAFLLSFFAFTVIGARMEKAHASEIDSSRYSYVVPEQEQERSLQESIQAIMAKKSMTREVPEYSSYDFVPIATKYATASGYAGNQPSYGTRFPTGGGFYWSNGGGPTVSVSVSFSVPSTPISVGISLGNSSSSAKFVTVPNTVNYFKLKSERTYKVVQNAVYGYPLNGGNRVFLYYIYPSSLYSESAWAERQ